MDKSDDPGTHLVIGPEGRYLVENNTLRPVVEQHSDHQHAAGELDAETGLAEKLAGTSLSDLQRDLAQLPTTSK